MVGDSRVPASRSVRLLHGVLTRGAGEKLVTHITRISMGVGAALLLAALLALWILRLQASVSTAEPGQDQESRLLSSATLDAPSESSRSTRTAAPAMPSSTDSPVTDPADPSSTAERVRLHVRTAGGRAVDRDIEVVELVGDWYERELHPPLLVGSARRSVHADGVVDLERRTGQQVFWVRAPDLAWARVVLDHDAGGERTVMLGAGAEVRIALVGAALHSASQVTLERVFKRPGIQGSFTEIVWSASASTLAGECVITGLGPGSYRAVVALGDGGNGSELSHVNFVVAGQSRLDVTLLVPEVLAGEVRVSVDSRAPAAAADEVLVLARLAPNGSSAREVARRVLRRSESAGVVSAAATEFIDLPPGDYGVALLPWSVTSLFTLDPGGTVEVQLKVQAPVALELEVLDVDPPSEAVARAPLPKQVGWCSLAHRELSSQAVVRTRVEDPSRPIVVATQTGPTQFVVWMDDGSVRSGEMDVRANSERVALRRPILAPVAGGATAAMETVLELWDGQAPLPMPSGWWVALQAGDLGVVSVRPELGSSGYFASRATIVVDPNAFHEISLPQAAGYECEGSGVLTLAELATGRCRIGFRACE